MRNKKEIEELRTVMGTLPDQSPKLDTEFIRGVEGIEVKLIDYNINPYRSMYTMATSCWGKRIDKWKETSPENRFLVVKAVLEGQALPLALEAPSFTFAIEGPSRAAFDQLARTRIGAVFSARGVRDNNWKDAAIRIPTCLWPEKEWLENHDSSDPKDLNNKISNAILGVKEVYSEIVDKGKGSWQAARFILPMNMVYGWSVNYNYMSLRGVCANRMKFCEMEDTVATAWLMARAVRSRFPLLGAYLRPGCDYAGKCQYHKTYSLSECFGCLFKECGRNPCPDSNDYAEFNEVCTSAEELSKQLGIELEGPQDWSNYESFEDLHPWDKSLFEGRVDIRDKS